MKAFCILLFFTSTITLVFGQRNISKVIIDDETGLPIANAHIYIDRQFKKGTKTNLDGRFILKGVYKNEVVEISHISYESYKKVVEKITADTIRVSKKSVGLDEIIIHAASGSEIMARVINAITMNHFVEPVMYSVYVRTLEYEQDYSELHMLSEYLMAVYQNVRSNSEFDLLKVRVKPFSDAGKKHLKDMRMINGIAIHVDNIFKYQYAIFKNKNLKKYNFEILEDSKEDKNLIKLHCFPKKKEEFHSIILWISKSSYAVQKMVKFYSESKEEFYEIRFKEVKGKWYLDYSKRKIYSDFYTIWQPESKSVVERTAIYNINSAKSYDSKIFKPTFIQVDQIKRHSSPWLDGFWNDHNYVPLPEWIQKKIDNVP